MAAFVPAMTNHTRDGFFEAIAVALEGAHRRAGVQ